MNVEIIKSSKSTYWYSKEIGNSFEVEYLLAENPLNILRVSNLRSKPKYIKISDCKFLN